MRKHYVGCDVRSKTVKEKETHLHKERERESRRAKRGLTPNLAQRRKSSVHSHTLLQYVCNSFSYYIFPD